MTGDTPEPAPLSVRARPRPITRLNRKLVIVVGMLFAGLMVLLLTYGLQPPRPRLTGPASPGVTTKTGFPEFLSLGPKSYRELQRSIPAAVPAGVAEAAPSPPPVVPPPSPSASVVPPPASPPPLPPPAPALRPASVPVQGKVPQPAPIRPAVAAPPKPRPWLFAALKADTGIAAPPFPLDDEAPLVKEGDGKEGKPAEGRGVLSAAKRAQSLFPQALWGTPEDPTRVLYRSQVINGLLQHAINSDHPGLVRVLVTEEVQDRFGQGQTLLPQYTILLGTQEGKVAYGQSRLPITIETAELPDGTVVAFNKTKLADGTGAAGVAGSVDNHWAQVGIGAVLTAILSVGSRSVAGSPSGFQPNIGQDLAADASKSINTTGQQIVRRSLEVNPTITIPAATQVTIQLGENVSFQTPAPVVRK